VSRVVSVQRTLAGDLTEAARFGATESGGIRRLAWTTELAQVTAWVAAELGRLGLETGEDAAGNLIARWPGPAGPAVMAGSHLDTVPDGGAFDGVLGVLAAVEAVRRLRREGFVPTRPIWIAAFMDEEGSRFGAALFGSRAFCGEDLSAVLAAVDREGIALPEAMAARGFDAERLAEAQRVAEVGAYVELHIEQGPILQARGRRCGIVERICGICGYRIAFDGEANHAGTTPMDMRRDALVGAARLAVAVRERARSDVELRATVGDIRVRPAARNVVPGRSELTVDLRPVTPERFAGASGWLKEMTRQIADEEGLEATIDCDYAIPPTAMDAGLIDVLDEAARAEGAEPLRMVSGAGHDAMAVGTHVPAAMLFVPSRGGISHSPSEWTETADCELGARVLAGALRRLAAPEGTAR
jgi:hydantoinase/carbamoylase family amidase